MGHVTVWKQLKSKPVVWKVNLRNFPGCSRDEDMEKMVENLRDVKDGFINSNIYLMRGKYRR